MATPLLSVEEARQRFLAAANPVEATETLPVTRALGRVLAEDVVAAVSVPPADNSAMDGYAYNRGQAEQAGFVLPIDQRIAAGSAPEPLAPGSAARIFTGAEIPAGADTVAMQEDCEARDDGAVAISPEVGGGANIRPRGQDIEQGQRILFRGSRLRPQEMGLLASVGVAAVTVYRPLKVAVFSTGDELVEPGKALGPGQIYNSNRATLAGLIGALDMEMVDLGNVPDTAEATEAALRRGAAEADVVVSSGGVSVGEEDHVVATLNKLGTVDFWKIAVKPGKPLAFGAVDGTPFVGLPGNPASVLVGGLIFLRPFLLALQGVTAPDVAPIPVSARFDCKAGKRQEYLRARLTAEGLEIAANQSSGVLSSACRGDGLAVIEPDRAVSKGEAVMFYSYASLFQSGFHVGSNHDSD